MNTYNLFNNNKSGRDFLRQIIRTPFTFAAMAALCLLLGAHPVPSIATTYTVTDLGTLGGNESGGSGINVSGQVVGYSKTSNGQTHAFVTQNGAMTDLGTLGGDNSSGRDINDSGQVSGSSDTNSGFRHAFVTQNGVMTDLGTLGANYSHGISINASGQTAGVSFSIPPWVAHAFVTQNGVMTDLGTLGGKESYGWGINACGQVSGYSETTGHEVHAFVTQNGNMTDLGTLGGGFSQGYRINANGQVTGYSKTTNGQYHAFVTQNGVMTDLDPLGGNDSIGIGINATGQVVGFSVIAGLPHTTHAFISVGEFMTDLNNLIDSSSGWTLSAAYDINDSGQITGEGVNPAGQLHAFLLTPVPVDPCPALLKQIQRLESSLDEEPGPDLAERKQILIQLGRLREQARKLGCL